MELDHEKMNLVKVLADTNMKISEAKAALFKLQENETEYLELREKKAVARIQKMLEDSRELLTETEQNYNEVHRFHETVSKFAEYLVSSHVKFSELLEDFKKRSEVWDAYVDKQNSDLSEIRKNIKSDQVRIINDREGIDRAMKKIESEKSVIESRQAQIKIALEVLNKKNGS